jgi:hypothetical protein
MGSNEGKEQIFLPSGMGNTKGFTMLTPKYTFLLSLWQNYTTSVPLLPLLHDGYLLASACLHSSLLC